MTSLRWFSVGTLAGIIILVLSSIGRSVQSSDQINVIVIKLILLASGLAWYYGLLFLIIIITPFLTFERLRKRIVDVKKADFVMGVAWGFAIAELALMIITHTSNLTDLVLQTSNSKTTISDIWIQVGLVIATLLIAVISWWGIKRTHEDTQTSLTHTETQLELTRKELESRLCAQLRPFSDRVDIHQENLGNGTITYTGICEMALQNMGSLSASNVRVYYGNLQRSDNLREVIEDENNIKQKLFRIRGSILPTASASAPKLEILLPNSNPFVLVAWVMYDDLELKDREFIYVIKISSGNHYDDIALYEKPEIERIRKELN